jgi:hypothetical protein
MKEQEQKIIELEAKIIDIENTLYGKKTNVVQANEKSIKEDKLLKAINQQIQKLNQEYNGRHASLQL